MKEIPTFTHIKKVSGSFCRKDNLILNHHTILKSSAKSPLFCNRGKACIVSKHCEKNISSAPPSHFPECIPPVRRGSTHIFSCFDFSCLRSFLLSAALCVRLERLDVRCCVCGSWQVASGDRNRWDCY